MSRWEEINVEKKEKRELYVPEMRANYASPCLRFSKRNRWGSGLKIALRRVAKALPEYHLPIKNSYLPMTVTTQEGDEVEVNTLGRWAFGVPGYAGHLIFAGGEEKVTIYYPQGSPQELVSLLREAVQRLR